VTKKIEPMTHTGKLEVKYMWSRNVWRISYQGHRVAVQQWSPLWWVRWRIDRLLNRVDSGYYQKKQDREESKENKILQGRKDKSEEIESIVKELV